MGPSFPAVDKPRQLQDWSVDNPGLGAGRSSPAVARQYLFVRGPTGPLAHQPNGQPVGSLTNNRCPGNRGGTTAHTKTRFVDRPVCQPRGNCGPSGWPIGQSIGLQFAKYFRYFRYLKYLKRLKFLKSRNILDILSILGILGFADFRKYLKHLKNLKNVKYLNF